MELWNRLVEAVRQASPFLHDYLKIGTPVSLSKNLLTIGFDSEFPEHMAFVGNPKSREALQNKLSELGYPNVQVKVVEAPAPPSRPPEPAPAPAPAPTPASAAAEPPRQNPPPADAGKDDFMNDPLIQKALEVFKGQIVDVR
jgi:DNA polymerase-3 subunit gamma/tau